MKTGLELDGFARDVAFELCLGGDRMDSDDMRFLDGTGRLEMNILKSRVEYHAEDFAPKGGWRNRDFVSNAFDSFMSKVDVDEMKTDISDQFMALMDESLRHRWKWFLFPDGQTRQCPTATLWNTWPEVKASWGSGAEPVEVPLAYVVRRRADDLLRFGREVLLDRPYVSVEIGQSMFSDDGTTVFLRRDVNTLAKTPEDHVYFITEKTPYGVESTALTEMSEGRLGLLLLDIDAALRSLDKLTRAQDDPRRIEGEISFSSPVPVHVGEPNEDGVDRFMVSSVFFRPDGAVMVSGNYDGVRMPAVHKDVFPLDSLSDKGIADVHAASGRVLSQILSSTKGKGASKDNGLSIN